MLLMLNIQPQKRLTTTSGVCISKVVEVAGVLCHQWGYTVKSAVGKNRKSFNFFLIFSIPEVTKLTLTLFLKAWAGPFSGSFAVVLLCIRPTNRWKVKGSLLIQTLVLLLPELEFCYFQKCNLFFQKYKIVYDYQGWWSTSFTVYNCLTMNP